MSEKLKTLAEATLDILIENQEIQLNRLKNLRQTWDKLPAQIKTEIDFPKIDLHELEHDGNWRSWKKDEKGLCSFPAEEGKAGWIRVSKSGNTAATLYKAMKQRDLQKVCLGLFEYKLTGDDFLHRIPLQKPENPHTKMQTNLSNIKKAGEALTQGK